MVVAEIGNNHEGQFSLAEELVGLAGEAGACAVKFQTFITEQYICPDMKERFARLKKFQLSYSQFEKLSAQARKAGLLFMSTPFDIESARFLKGIVDVIKIASADNNFYPLIKEVALTAKPLVMSTGLADTAVVKEAMGLIHGTWRDAGIHQEMALLHCVTSYPVPPEQANLLAIRSLASVFQCTVGYSDHTVGNEASTLAVAMGARIIEKHFTIDNNYSSFRDHQLSANPAGLKDLVQAVRRAETMLGSGNIGMEECEKADAQAIRRSISASQAMPAGTQLQVGHFSWLRPGGGLPPGQEGKLIGHMLKYPVSAGQAITLDMVD